MSVACAKDKIDRWRKSFNDKKKKTENWERKKKSKKKGKNCRYKHEIYDAVIVVHLRKKKRWKKNLSEEEEGEIILESLWRILLKVIWFKIKKKWELWKVFFPEWFPMFYFIHFIYFIYIHFVRKKKTTRLTFRIFIHSWFSHKFCIRKTGKQNKNLDINF